MSLWVGEVIVNDLLIIPWNHGGLRGLRRKVTQQKRQQQKRAGVKRPRQDKLFASETARTYGHITKKLVRNELQMSGIAGQNSAKPRPQGGTKEIARR